MVRTSSLAIEKDIPGTAPTLNMHEYEPEEIRTPKMKQR